MPKYKQLPENVNTFLYSSVKELPDSFNTDMITGKATADWDLHRNSLQIIDNITGKFLEYKLKTKEISYFPDCPVYSAYSAMVAVQGYNFYFDNATKKVYKFTQKTNSWAYVGTIPRGSSFDGITAIVSMEYVYIISKNLTSSKASSVFQRIQCYTNKWQSLPDLPVKHYKPLLLSRKNTIWLTGGSSSWTSTSANCNYMYAFQTHYITSNMKWQEKSKPYAGSSSYVSSYYIDPNSTITPYGITGDKFVFRDTSTVKIYDVNADKWIRQAIENYASSGTSTILIGGICMHEGYKEQNLFPDGSPYEVMAIGARIDSYASSDIDAPSQITGGSPIVLLYGNNSCVNCDAHNRKLYFNMCMKSNTTYLDSFKITNVKPVNRVSGPNPDGSLNTYYYGMMIYSNSNYHWVDASDVKLDASNIIKEYNPLEEGIEPDTSFTKITDTLCLDVSDIVESLPPNNYNNISLAINVSIEYKNKKTGLTEQTGLFVMLSLTIASSSQLEDTDDFPNKIKTIAIEQKSHEFFQDTIKSQNSAFYKNKIYIPYVNKNKQARIAEIDKDTFDVKSHKVFINENIIDVSNYDRIYFPYAVFVYKNSLYLIRGYTDECYNTYANSLYIYKINEKDFTLEFHKEINPKEFEYYMIDRIYDIFEIGDHHVALIGQYNVFFIDMRKDGSDYTKCTASMSTDRTQANLYHKTRELYIAGYSSSYVGIIGKDLSIRDEPIVRDYSAKALMLSNRKEMIFNVETGYYNSSIIRRNESGNIKPKVCRSLQDFRYGQYMFRYYSRDSEETIRLNMYIDDNSDIYTFFSGMSNVEDIVTHTDKKICGFKWAMPEKRYLYNINGKIYHSTTDDTMKLISGLTESNITEQDYLKYGDKVVNRYAINNIRNASSLDILMYHEEDEEFDVLMTAEIEPEPQLLLCDFDLSIDPTVAVKRVKATGVTKEASDIMIAVSTDQGATWKTFTNDAVKSISLDKLKTDGMDIDSFNFLTLDNLNSLIPKGTTTVRFAFSLRTHTDFNPKLDHVLIRG